MDIKECYDKMGADYSAALEQLGADSLIERFSLKFLQEGTMQTLRDAVKAGDITASFKAAHTLKGVAANLAFKNLYTAASNLTEQLRPCAQPADPALMEKVEECYELVIKTLTEYSEE